MLIHEDDHSKLFKRYSICVAVHKIACMCLVLHQKNSSCMFHSIELLAYSHRTEADFIQSNEPRQSKEGDNVCSLASASEFPQHPIDYLCCCYAM